MAKRKVSKMQKVKVLITGTRVNTVRAIQEPVQDHLIMQTRGRMNRTLLKALAEGDAKAKHPGWRNLQVQIIGFVQEAA